MKNLKTELKIRQYHARLSMQIDKLWMTTTPVATIHQLRYELDTALANDLKNLK